MTERQWLTTDRFRELVAFLAEPPGRPPRRLGGVVAAAARRLLGRPPPPGPAVPPSDRQFRLLTAACCRYVWRTAHVPYADLPLYRDGGWLGRIERLADGELTPADAEAVREFGLPPAHAFSGDELPLRAAVADNPRGFWGLAAHAKAIPMLQPFFPESSALGCELIRDVFG